MFMRRIVMVAAVPVLLAGLAACAQGTAATQTGEPAMQGVKLAFSSKSREASPSVPATDTGTLASGNTAFAFDLYQRLKEDEGNIFFSPYSISLALGMTYAGARGETERQMADVFHFTLPQATLHPAFNWLDIELESRGEGARGQDEGGFRLHIANSIWGQDGYQFRTEFLDTLAENYGAGMRLVDFVREPEPSRLAINKWVEDQTEDRIKDLIPEGAIDEMTRLVLANAIYFNAAWAKPFDEGFTAGRPFHLLGGSEIQTEAMSQEESFRYAAGPGYQAVELPYDGHELSMVILVPDVGSFKAFEESMDARLLEGVLEDMNSERVSLTMPKFSFESEFSLKGALEGLGMRTAFAPGEADLSGMDGTRDLYISAVVHKAFVAVDEQGTEAAAATGVVVGTTSAPIGEPIELTIDRPFVFLIRDNGTGTVLFVGRVVDPRG